MCSIRMTISCLAVVVGCASAPLAQDSGPRQFATDYVMEGQGLNPRDAH